MPINWELVDLEPLRAELRETLPGPEAERMIYAFDEAIRWPESTRICSTACSPPQCASVPSPTARTPRHVLEDFFRRSVSDEEWRGRYLELLA